MTKPLLNLALATTFAGALWGCQDEAKTAAGPTAAEQVFLHGAIYPPTRSSAR